MPEAATTSVVDAAYAVLDAEAELSGRGSKERAHPWNDPPRWLIEWENESVAGFQSGAYECDLDLVFTAWAAGDGANARVDAMRLAAQTALAGSGKLGGIVQSIRLVEASRDLDESGRAVTGTVRVTFRVRYDADVNGVLA